MKCENCDEREATVHYTEIDNGDKREIHLCEQCYRQKLTPVQEVADFTEVLQNLLQDTVSDLGSTPSAICPTCGVSVAEFRAAGRLGCAQDYHVFEEHLKVLLEKIQHGVRHVGKVPTKAGVTLKQQNELIRLRRKLERAVQREEYEQAAALRDKVRKLSENEDALG